MARGSEPLLRYLTEAWHDQSKLLHKRAARLRIYAAICLAYGEMYFGARMNSDARRCYWEARRRQPQWLFCPGVTRHFRAPLMGRGIYEAAKRAVGRRVPVEPVV